MKSESNQDSGRDDYFTIYLPLLERVWQVLEKQLEAAMAKGKPVKVNSEPLQNIRSQD